MTIKVRPKSRKATLRQIVGDRLTLGFAGAPDATGSTPLTVTYARPR